MAWLETSKKRPCTVCGQTKYCSYTDDGRMWTCRNVRQEGARDRTDKHGAHFYLYVDPSIETPDTIVPIFDNDQDSAPIEDRDRVYRAMIALLTLSPEHRQHLLERGLTHAAIDAAGYGSMPAKGRHKIAGTLIHKFGVDLCALIPGFIHKESADQPGSFYWTLAGQAGITIPARDVDGRISGMQIRSDDPHNTDHKYTWLSSKSHEGAGAVASCHVPLWDGPTATVRLTEGILKANISTFLGGVLTIGIPGCAMYKLALPVLEHFKPEKVLLSWDSDARTKESVGQSLERAFSEIRSVGFNVEVETWDDQHKGIDDLLKAGGKPIVQERPIEIYSDDPEHSALRAGFSTTVP